MKHTDNNPEAGLFLAPAGSVAPEDEADVADNSAEAMTRLRDPFAVRSAAPDERAPVTEAH
jgi:hypothetical protein